MLAPERKPQNAANATHPFFLRLLAPPLSSTFRLAGARWPALCIAMLYSSGVAMPLYPAPYAIAPVA